MKPNRLGSKKVEDLVYIHTNLRLLSHKDDKYVDGAAKLWDVALECANLDATLHDFTTMIDDDNDRSLTHGASNTSGTILGSNDIDPAQVDLAAVGDEEDPDFLENPYDFG